MSGSLNKLAPEIIKAGIFDNVKNYSKFNILLIYF